MTHPRRRLAGLPCIALGHGPTPLEFAPTLTKHLGGPRIFIKRDDCTGLAGGGNKARKLEFLLAEALRQGADVVLTVGATQSNHVRQTAAAAAKVGLACEVLLDGRVPVTTSDYERSGNMLLTELLGATIHRFPGGTDMNAALAKRTAEIARSGRKPFSIPVGGSTPLGSLGYADCAFEIGDQTRAFERPVNWIVHATGSTGTQAGLLAGFAAEADRPRVMGISVKQPKTVQEDNVFALAQTTGALIGTQPSRSEVHVDDRFVGDGYGLPTPEMIEAVHMAARLEGLLLDPVYSGKAMAGLIGLASDKFFPRSDTVVFIHTGGSAGLFAYRGIFQEG